MTDPLFSPFRLGPLTLANRIVCLPMYLAYPDPDHEVNSLVLDYYSEMADSGAGVVVVENCGVEPCGLGNPRSLLVSEDRFIPGLARLADAIKARGVPAVLQLHHAGRHAKRPDRIAPSAVETRGVIPKVMDQADIDRGVDAFAAGARRAKEAGFDAVELHGGMGYLLTQFLSARTNLRDDGYGDELAGRMRFPLEVLAAVRAEGGEGFPAGYRFLADEYVPGGLTLDETRPFALALASAGATYLSVMAGCYDSSPEYAEEDRREAFMATGCGKCRPPTRRSRRGRR
jgi:2,4-dienoyl-CoA reductase-like NADH-dependent reductase (Old Yellow Enzyme family)